MQGRALLRCMAVIVRIDVDRPYGRSFWIRHVFSRISSDFWLPRLPACGYFRELEVMLSLLNQRNARVYAFFCRCTIPSAAVHRLM